MLHVSAPATGRAAGGARRSPLADMIAAFATQTTIDALPRTVVEAAKRSILDTLAVSVAGTRSRAGQAAITAFTASGDGGTTHVIGTPLSTNPRTAALINGILGHALDFDDVWADDDGVVAWRGHPSVCVLPAVLAAAEIAGCDGAAVLSAYVIGVEVAGKLGTVFGPNLGRIGWHPTSVVGTVGAAAAVASILGLDGERTAIALGLAATEAFGLHRNFGTDTKPFHAGHAAECGLQAALLARVGFTANPEAVADYLRVHGGPDEASAVARLTTLGQTYDLAEPGLSIKKYPCCRFAHLPLDATFTLLNQEPMSLDALETFTVRIQPGADDALVYTDPRTGLEGKFSMTYLLAAALLDGEVTLASFTDAMVTRPQVRALMERIQTAYKPEPGAEVVAQTRVGTFRAAATVVRGDPANPLSWDELVQKVHQCLHGVLPPGRADRIVTAVAELEHLIDIHLLSGLLEAEA